MFPILIRSKDRPFYLNTTLKSLMATNLEDGIIVIADDCSSTEEMNDFLFTNKKVILPEFNWYEEIETEITTSGSIVKDVENLSNKEIWDRYIGNVPIETTLYGLKNKFNVIQPKENMGDVGGLFWTIYAGFTLFRNAEKIVILEDDLIFNKNWLKISNLIFNKEYLSNLGCISVYNRENIDYFNPTKSRNLYNEINGIGGVMYMIPRDVFDLMKADGFFDKYYDKKILGGDVIFQKYLNTKNLKILNTSSSYIQHIGIKSICRPGRFLRYSKNFIQPFAWSKNL